MKLILFLTKRLFKGAVAFASLFALGYVLYHLPTRQERLEAQERALKYRCADLTHADSSKIAFDWYVKGFPPYPPKK